MTISDEHKKKISTKQKMWAEIRKCPLCGRKSALSWYVSMNKCRWCGFEERTRGNVPYGFDAEKPALPVPVKQYGENRKCVICGNTLSIYNKLNQCFHHEAVEGCPETYPIHWSPTTLCTGSSDVGLYQELVEKGVYEDTR